MGTTAECGNLSSALFGKTRRAVLALLFGHPDESFYLRQVVRSVAAGQGAVQRELKCLAGAGVIRRATRGRQVYYQADADCPIFAELRDLVTKTAGVAEVLRAALAPFGERVAVALLFGSLAGGRHRRGSDVDLLVVGDVSFREVVAAVGPAQERLGREVNPCVYSAAEFRRKLAAGQHFLCAVLRGPKVFVIGGQRELARLAEQPMAHRTPDQPGRDRRPARRGRPRLA